MAGTKIRILAWMSATLNGMWNTSAVQEKGCAASMVTTWGELVHDPRPRIFTCSTLEPASQQTSKKGSPCGLETAYDHGPGNCI